MNQMRLSAREDIKLGEGGLRSEGGRAAFLHQLVRKTSQE